MVFAFFLWMFLQTSHWTCTTQRDFNISFHNQTANSSQYDFTESPEEESAVVNLNHIFAKHSAPPHSPGLQCADNYVVDKRNNICREKLPSPTVAMSRSKYHFINGSETTNMTNGTNVFWRMNCSNQSRLMVDEGDFLVLENKSVFVNASKMTYDKSEYIWMNRSVLVCVNHAVAYQTNCSGNWGLMNESEYSILSNKSIYVNASRMLYDPPKFIWNKQNLYVCDNLFVESDNRNIMSNEDDDIISDLTIVCMSISIFALVFVLITYSLFAELRTPPGINLMNLSVAILLSQLLWLVGSKKLTDKPMACTAIAVLLHYFFLVSFVWTSIIAFDTWRAFTAKGRRPMVDSKRKRLLQSLRYMAIGWLSAMVYVSICVTLDQSQTVTIGYGSRAACWITNFNAKWIFFATPLGLVTVFNIVFFSMTVKAIRSSRSHARMVDKPANKRDFGVYVRIASVMGFTWVFGFAAPFGWMILWYVYVILSSLQGVYIAIAFALNKRARNLYIKLLCKTKVLASRDAHSVDGKDRQKDKTKDRPTTSLQKFKTLNVSNL